MLTAKALAQHKFSRLRNLIYLSITAIHIVGQRKFCYITVGNDIEATKAQQLDPVVESPVAIAWTCFKVCKNLQNLCLVQSNYSSSGVLSSTFGPAQYNGRGKLSIVPVIHDVDSFSDGFPVFF